MGRNVNYDYWVESIPWPTMTLTPVRLQNYSALKAKADVIITRNGKDFMASKIPVMTATEFLNNDH